MKNKSGFILTVFLMLGSCSSVVKSASSSSVVLSIAPYQNSAITLLSPDGKNSKAATFQRFNGELTMQKDKPSSVKFSVQTDSIATSDKMLITTLGEKDFFDTKKFPVAEFQSSEIKKDESSGAQPEAYLVNGDLNFRGEKIKMQVPASMTITEKEVSMMIQLSISNKDWMEKLKTSPDAFFKDHMEVVAKLVFPKPVKELPVAKIEEKKNQEIKVDQKTFDAIKEKVSAGDVKIKTEVKKEVTKETVKQ